MNKKIVIIIVIILTLVAIFIGQRYLLNKQKVQNENYIFAMKEKCKKAGEKVDQERIENPLYSTTNVEPEYTYNKKLNTCLYYVEYRFGPNPPYESYIGIVKDTLSNELIMQFHARIDKDDTLLSCEGCTNKEDFYHKKAELFNQ